MINEAELVILIYFLIGLVVLMGTLIVFLYSSFKGMVEETTEFIKLMVALYEAEQEKHKDWTQKEA